MEILFDVRNEILVQFLGFLFKKDGDIFVVSRSKDFGKLCCARYSESKVPVKQKIGNLTVKFRLPQSDGTYSASSSFIYFSKENTEKLNDELEATFNLDFDRYYLKGKKLSFKQKEIIEAYIYTRLFHCGCDKLEMLKKREYREEEKMLNKLRQFLKNKAYHANEQIDKHIHDEISSCISDF